MTESWEDDAWEADDGVLHGDYAFTLAESCVQQNNLMPPSIPMFVGIPIPTPAPTQLSPGAPILADGAIAADRAGAGAIAQDARGILLALSNRALPRMTNKERD